MPNLRRAVHVGTLTIALTLIATFSSAQTVYVPGESRAWEPLTLEIEGPDATEDGTPNPFLDVRLTATFWCGEAQTIVSGYFAADGRAANTGASAGRIWRVHFVPDRAGEWHYEISVRGGPGIAVREHIEGSPLPGDGVTGRFTVVENPGAKGILRHQNSRYLHFSNNGESFLKAGADSPENLLAYTDFDGTESGRGRSGANRDGEAEVSSLHTYEPHIADWREGDPTWRRGKGKGLIGALNYLASRGVNSVYFITMNIEGDGRDVWPYTSIGERTRFDCSKLDQWEIVFQHADRLGIALHVLLTETENENVFEYESGCCDFAETRKLYYRELVARFGHHTALVWNLGEENGGNDGPEENPNPFGLANTDAQRKAFADYLRDLDPYDHPIVVHTFPGQHEKIYRPLLGHPTIDGPSLQMGKMERTHTETIKWIDASRESGHPWFVCLDEIGPADTGVKPDADDADHDDVRHHALWGNLMAGGAGVEWYFGYKYPHNDLNLEDFRSRERLWDQSSIALEFFRRYLPFTEMRHDDQLLTNREAFAFAKPGEVYAVYLPRGGQSTEIDLLEGNYTLEWFDPRRGGELESGSESRLSGAGRHALGSPPRDPERDWVALIRRR